MHYKSGWNPFWGPDIMVSAHILFVKEKPFLIFFFPSQYGVYELIGWRSITAFNIAMTHCIVINENYVHHKLHLFFFYVILQEVVWCHWGVCVGVCIMSCMCICGLFKMCKIIILVQMKYSCIFRACWEEKKLHQSWCVCVCFPHWTTVNSAYVESVGTEEIALT